jgi:hypothetical protein
MRRSFTKKKAQKEQIAIMQEKLWPVWKQKLNWTGESPVHTSNFASRKLFRT